MLAKAQEDKKKSTPGTFSVVPPSYYDAMIDVLSIEGKQKPIARDFDDDFIDF